MPAKLKKLKPDVFLASHGSAFDLPEKMSRLADKSRNPSSKPKPTRLT